MNTPASSQPASSPPVSAPSVSAEPGPSPLTAAQPASRLVGSGRHVDAPATIASVPVYRASTVLFDSLSEAESAGRRGAQGVRHVTSYGVGGTPGTMALTDALCEIEGAGHDCRAALMPSGLNAISTLFLALLQPGDHLLVPDSAYGPTRAVCDGLMTRMGVVVEYYDPATSAEDLLPRLRERTRMIYLESPGSYTFELQDVPAICALARARGILTAVDNAWASPVFARPFDWGVDASVLPLTKYWSGHSDVLMGAIVVREALWPQLWSAVKQMGVCVGGDDAFLVLRGLRTADVRMRRHQDNALAVARWLETRPEVRRVLHPGLASHPQHALWQRDFSGSSGLFSFEIDPAATGGLGAGFNAATAAFSEGRRFFGIGYSWGGFESLIMPGRLSGIRTVRPWDGGALIRLHVGLEDPADLIADLGDGFAEMRQAVAGG
jgi:cystathionine beta-lyase